MQNIDGYIYDYCGCKYPHGVSDKYHNLYFNRDDISEIIKLGLVDKETKEILDKINSCKNNTF